MNSMHSLEVRIPIGPTPSMINRVHLIALSIQSLGPEYKNVKIRASVGSVGNFTIDAPWAEKLNVEFSKVDQTSMRKWAGRANPNIPTMVYDRYLTDMPHSTYILMLDADVLAVRPFDELMTAFASPVQAVMAHTSPFNDNHRWKEILGENYQRFGEHEVSGFGIMEHDENRRLSPPYFNTGVVLMTQTLFRPYLRNLHASCLDELSHVLNSYFVDQIALTNAIIEGAVPYSTLPIRFNFPNQAEFDRKYPEDLADVRFIHFLRSDVINRDRDFESIAAIEKLVMRKDLKGSNEALRARVEELLPAMREK